MTLEGTSANAMPTPSAVCHKWATDVRVSGSECWSNVGKLADDTYLAVLPPASCADIVADDSSDKSILIDVVDSCG